MAKLSYTELQNELEKRLYNVFPDDTTTQEAIKRAVRTIDSLASYMFLQKETTFNLSYQTFTTIPNDLNAHKEMKLYINSINVSYVPYSELPKYSEVIQGSYIPAAFAYVVGATNYFYFSSVTNGSGRLVYQKIMTQPSATNYAEIPEEWYDIIVDVAEWQQKELYNIALSEVAKQNTIERIKMFLREYNASQTTIININDELIRKGG